ncbi:MAG: plasmid partitioning protein RepB C-terminal domain-containing protein [Pseudomonadota bacterium]
MSEDVRLAFELGWQTIELDQILPRKIVSEKTLKAKVPQQIADSIREVGLVEPLVVYPVGSKKTGQYTLIDGHLRLAILKAQGATEAICIVTKDDEAYTYNKRVNRLSSVQEHFMILRALENGVSEDRLASALGLNITSIRRKQGLLRGICPEAVAILSEARFSHATAAIFRRTKPIRQIEMAELMRAANNYSISYARALFVATPPIQLLNPTQKQPRYGLNPEERARMEAEMDKLRRDMKAVEDQFGTNMLRLVVANGYIGRLLENDTICSYLRQHHEVILDQLLTLQDSIDGDMGLGAE